MNRLREIRVIKRITQFQLALATGIHPSKISLLENGLVQPRGDEKIRLALALKIQPTEIWGASGSERKNDAGNAHVAG